MSEHFKESEFILSKTAQERGIDNSLPPYLKMAMLFTIAGMERIRASLGDKAIIVHSGFRSAALNLAVKGSNNSQHMKGEACDFTCPDFGRPIQIALYLKDRMAELGIDQMILEGTWVHVSFTFTPRKQVLTFSDGKYLPGIC